MDRESDSMIRRSLFSDVISRSAILEARDSEIQGLKSIQINIWRNTGIEAFLPIIEPYLEFFYFKADFQISSYDSSLDLRNWKKADIDLIYLSTDEMNLEDTKELIKSRISLLYNLGSKNISVALQFPSNAEDSSGFSDYLRAEFPGVPILEINRKNLSPNFSFEDKRLQSI